MPITEWKYTTKRYWKGLTLIIQYEYEVITRSGNEAWGSSGVLDYNTIDFAPLAFFIVISLLVISTIPFAF